MVASERLVQTGVDDAFVVLNLGHEHAVGIEVVHVRTGKRAVIAGNPNDDAGRAGGERASKLPVATEEARQRPRTVLREAPEDHHLEAGIEDERVGHPRGPERIQEPFGRCRCRVRGADERGIGEAIDSFDAV